MYMALKRVHKVVCTAASRLASAAGVEGVTSLSSEYNLILRIQHEPPAKLARLQAARRSSICVIQVAFVTSYINTHEWEQPEH